METCNVQMLCRSWHVAFKATSVSELHILESYCGALMETCNVKCSGRSWHIDFKPTETDLLFLGYLTSPATVQVRESGVFCTYEVL